MATTIINERKLFQLLVRKLFPERSASNCLGVLLLLDTQVDIVFPLQIVTVLNSVCNILCTHIKNITADFQIDGNDLLKYLLGSFRNYEKLVRLLKIMVILM